VTLPDGTVATRTTERSYTHAVVALYGKPIWGYDADGHFVLKGTQPPVWTVLTWTTQPDKALSRELASRLPGVRKEIQLVRVR
jgi:hypothetical protein